MGNELEKQRQIMQIGSHDLRKELAKQSTFSQSFVFETDLSEKVDEDDYEEDYNMDYLMD